MQLEHDTRSCIGLWVNAVRDVDGVRTAWDSGTAIVAAYRGRGLGRRMARLSTELLVDAGVSRYLLEVHQDNETAYRLYLSDGFIVRRELHCLRTTTPRVDDIELAPDLTLEEGPFDPAIADELPAPEAAPSWQNSMASMVAVAERVHAVVVRRDAAIVGYGLVTPQRGRITQLGVADGYWDTTVPAAILCALCRARRSDEVVVINVETTAGRFLALLRDHGFEPLLDQFEMVKDLTDHK